MIRFRLTGDSSTLKQAAEEGKKSLKDLKSEYIKSSDAAKLAEKNAKDAADAYKKAADSGSANAKELRKLQNAQYSTAEASRKASEEAKRAAQKYLSAAEESAKATNALKKELREGVTTAATWSAAMAAAGVAIGAHLVDKALEAIDAQSKLAQTLKTTSAGLAVSAKAADLSGVSFSSLEQATKDLTRRLSQAAAGAGPAKDALDRLHLSADELSRMPLDKRIETINQAIRDFIPPAQQAAVAGQLFGEEGSLAIQRMSPETIREARKEVEKFGLAISDVDAAKVEAVNDAMAGVRDVVKGLIQNIAVNLAPVIEALSKQFIQTATAGESMGKKADKAFGFIVEATAFVINAIDGVKRAFEVVADIIIHNFAFVKKQVTAAIASIIEFVNKIPGVDLQDTVDEFRAMAAEADSVMTQARDHIDEVLMRPMPGDAFKGFVADAQEAAEASAQAVVDARKKMEEEMAAKSGGGGGLSDDELAKLQEKLEALRDAYKTEQELLAEKLAGERELLLEAYENKLIDQEEYLARDLEINATYQDQLNKMEEDAAKKRKAIADAEKAARLNAVKGMFSQLSVLMNSESRKMFEVGKAAAIGQAIVNTYQSATGAYSAMASIPYVGPILGAAAAAAAIAAGLANVQAIRSQSFGGGGAGAAATGSNTAAVNAASTPVAGPAGANAGQTLFVNGLNPGDLFSGGMVRELAGKLVDFQKDGGQVVIAQ